MSSRRTTKTPEGYVQSAILELLALERIWHVRLNSRTVMLPGRGGRMRPVFFGAPGMADILCTPWVALPNQPREPGRVLATVTGILWIECKSETGRQSDDQKAFEQSVTEAGHFYLLARSVDDVLAWLEAHR